MRAASEAVIEALVVVDVEARRLFVVKRAAGLPFPPGADKLDRAPDHARQRHAVAQFVQKGGGDRHPPPLPLKDGAVKGGVLDVPHTTPAPPSPVRLPGSCPSGRRSALSAPPSPEIGRAHVELQSLMRISYAVFCLKKKKKQC